jgi:LysM repeat protein
MAPRRSQARWLAPLALVACAVAVYAVASSGTNDGSPEARPKATASPGRKAPDDGSTITTAAARTSPTRRYTIKAGDTLSAIAAASGVSVDAILRLNPGLDVQALQTGQTIKLAP